MHRVKGEAPPPSSPPLPSPLYQHVIRVDKRGITMTTTVPANQTISQRLQRPAVTSCLAAKQQRCADRAYFGPLFVRNAVRSAHDRSASLRRSTVTKTGGEFTSPPPDWRGVDIFFVTYISAKVAPIGVKFCTMIHVSRM